MCKFFLVIFSLIVFPLSAQIQVSSNAQNYTNIGDAVDAALGNGGLTADTEIWISDGIYKASENNVIDIRSGYGYATNGFTLRIIGVGNNVFIDGEDSLQVLIMISGVSNISFDRINLQNMQTLTDLGGGGIYIVGNNTTASATQNITFKNASIRKGFVGTRAINHFKNVTFENVVFSDFVFGSVRYGSPPDEVFNLSFRGCVFTTALNPISPEGVVHILVKDADSVIIEDCFFGKTSSNAMAINSSQHIVLRRNIIMGAGSATGKSTVACGGVSPFLEKEIFIENNFIIGNRSYIFSFTDATKVKINNNTIVSSRQDVIGNIAYISGIDSMFFYNNLVYARGLINIAFFNIESKVSTIQPGVNLFADYNNYFLSSSSNTTKVWGSNSGGLQPWTLALNNVIPHGQELNSSYNNLLQSKNPMGFVWHDTTSLESDYTNWFLKDLSANGVNSVARNTSFPAYTPALDLRKYVRDSISDRGAFDMEGVALNLYQADFSIVYNGVIQLDSFGVEVGDSVQIFDNSPQGVSRFFEIIDDGIINTSSNDSSFYKKFTPTDLGKQFTVNMLGVGSANQSKYVQKINIIRVGSAPQIIMNPIDTAVDEGQYAGFYVDATGLPQVSFLWQYKENGQWVDIQDSADSALVIKTNVGDNSKLFRCIAYNIIGADTSDEALLTIRKVCIPVYDSLSVSTCDSFEFGNKIITQSGIYIDTLVSAQACDSIRYLHLNIYSSFIDTLFVESCSSYMFKGQNLMNSGSYVDSMQTNFGCDSIYFLELVINPVVDTNIYVSACDSVLYDNTWYYNTSAYIDTLESSLGCDSILRLYINVENTFYKEDTVSTCDNYNFNGRVLSASGYYVDTLQGINGCDSILSLALTVNDTRDTSITVSHCNAYTLGAHTYTQSGMYVDSLITVNGCDSLVYLDININPIKYDTLQVEACNSYLFAGEMYLMSGLYYDTLVSKELCDSIVILDLTLHYSTQQTIIETHCNHYEYNGNIYNQSGTYTDTLTSEFGCDSIVILQLTIINSQQTFISETVCGSYNFNGNTYTQSGTYIDTLFGIGGCDSIVNISLTITPEKRDTLLINACDSFSYKGDKYTSSVEILDTNTLASGCDSITLLKVFIGKSHALNDSVTICKGDNYRFPNGVRLLNIQGGITYQSLLSSSTYCDSIIYTYLTVSDPILTVKDSLNALIANQLNAEYQWLYCDSTMAKVSGATQRYFYPSISGSYAVEITQNQCVDTSRCIRYTAVGLMENKITDIEIYPNPTGGLLQIDFPYAYSWITLSFSSAYGSLVMKKYIQGRENIELNISQLPSGVYMLLITSPDGFFEKKVIKY